MNVYRFPEDDELTMFRSTILARNREHNELSVSLINPLLIGSLRLINFSDNSLLRVGSRSVISIRLELIANSLRQYAPSPSPTPSYIGSEDAPICILACKISVFGRLTAIPGTHFAAYAARPASFRPSQSVRLRCHFLR